MSDHTTARPRATFRYTGRLAQDIESRWQAYWDEHETFRTPNPGDPGFDPARPKYFCLDMFPYPSGAGLHVGHPEGYTATDIVCRYKRMRGFNVLHPMGWDAFGLPAEQYAIQTGVHPRETTAKAIDTFRRQLKRFGFSYDWSREFATIDPDYYRWTQWIWLQAYGSWFDRRTSKARPLDVLRADLESGALTVDEDDQPVPSGGRPWATLDARAQRAVIDGQRLAYLGTQTVNWCPKLGTALANEEVIDGRSERGSYPVLRKPLQQWMFRITAYADRLLHDLERLDWPESTRRMQQEWIGRSEGAEIRFPLVDPPAGADTALRVYTTRPDTIFGATYMVVAPEHPLVDALLADPRPETDVAALTTYVEASRNRADVDRMTESKEKTGVDTGLRVTNPATGAPIPIWVADYVLMGYGHGAIMAVPAHDQRDHDFARAFDLPIVTVVEPTDGSTVSAGEAFAGIGRAVASASAEVSLDGLPTADAKQTLIAWLERTGRGRHQVNYRLRDWLFSRQRYWGEPFPIVYGPDGEHVGVSEAHLPVRLPDMTDYQPVESDDPTPLLGKATDWVHTTAGAAGVDPGVLAPDTPVRRETNTMPGWAGSCWYYLRFCTPHDDGRFVSRDAERYWMLARKGDASPVMEDEPFDAEKHHAGGVDLYVGGAEHAVLHLLYARFWHKMLFDLGEVSTPEPVGRLFHQGLITSFAFQREDKTLVPVDEVDETSEDVFVERSTGQPVTRTTAKMSKSLRNVVNPDDIIAEFGADTFRLYEMYMGPLEASKPWNTKDMVGLFRFLQRVWRLMIDEEDGTPRLAKTADDDIESALHRTIDKVAGDIERLAFNTAIAAMIEFVNLAHKSDGLTEDQGARFVTILGPFAPHLAEELWARLGRSGCAAQARWPEVDPGRLTADTVELPVQINGKVRARIDVPSDASREAIEGAARAAVADAIEGMSVRKVIIVPGKIVNLIVG